MNVVVNLLKKIIELNKILLYMILYNNVPS